MCIHRTGEHTTKHGPQTSHVVQRSKAHLGMDNTVCLTQETVYHEKSPGELINI